MGISHTDLLVAVTESDAVNLAVCHLAGSPRMNVPRAIARVRNPEFDCEQPYVASDHFSIDQFISPEGLAVKLIAKLWKYPGTVDAMTFDRQRLSVHAVIVSEESVVAEMSVREAHEHLGGGFLFAAIRRGHRVFIPDGNERLRIGDSVYIADTGKRIADLTAALHPISSDNQRLLISGASFTARLVAADQAKRGRRVTMIVDDAAEALRAAEELEAHRVAVLHGSVLDDELLLRSGVEYIDTYLALSDNDEENLMSSLLVRRLSRHGRVVILSNRKHYQDILEAIDIDLVVNPRQLAINALLRHIRGHSVMSVAKLNNDDAEISEIKLNRPRKALGVPMYKLPLAANGILVTAYLRDETMHIAGGATELQLGDHVIIFADKRGRKALDTYFG